ncbi:MAG: DUF1080 domain-containing protein [Cyclobacteriaceae bacterium]|nr:DUF1080 domain-containing protein [Cyclobacteriaceae bacterium]
MHRLSLFVGLFLILILQVKPYLKADAFALIEETPRLDITKTLQDEGFVALFNGEDLSGWIGDTKNHKAKDGMLICTTKGGNIYTKDEYSDFIIRFEFLLSPGSNNGLGIRMPLKGNPSYDGTEIQILDNTAEKYSQLRDYQYHGSVYGVIPAKRGFLNPVGEWNFQEVHVTGSKVKVILNGEIIVDGDLAEASNNYTETIDKRSHPGIEREKGHIGFLGHGSEVKFRNIYLKDLSKP